MVSPALSRELSGIALFVFAMACFAVMNTVIRGMASEVSPFFLVFLRNVISCALMLPWLLHHGVGGLATKRLGRHFWRAFIGIIAMETWFYSLAHMPLNEATALSFTAPLFAAVFAVLLLGERVGPARIAALVTGFAGAMLIIRPGMGGSQGAALLVLFSAAMMALAGTVVKTLTATDPPWRIVTYMSVFMVIFSAPLGILYWQALSPAQWIGALAIAVCSTAAQMAMVSSFMRAEVIVLVPFDFMRLVFTAILAYVVFGEPLGPRTLAGACVIVASAAFITWRETRKRHARQPASPPSGPA